MATTWPIKTFIVFAAIFSTAFFVFFTTRDFPLGTDGDYTAASELKFATNHGFNITCTGKSYEGINTATWFIGVVFFLLVMVLTNAFRFLWIQRAKSIGRRIRVEKTIRENKGEMGTINLDTTASPPRLTITNNAGNLMSETTVLSPSVYINTSIFFLCKAALAAIWVFSVRVFAPNVVRCHDIRKSAVEPLPVISFVLIFLLIVYMIATESSYRTGAWVRFVIDPSISMSDIENGVVPERDFNAKSSITVRVNGQIVKLPPSSTYDSTAFVPQTQPRVYAQESPIPAAI